MWLARFGVPFVNIYGQLTNSNPRFTTISLNALESHRNISHKKASDELDYQPRSLRDTIKDTVRWFDENGYLIRSVKYQ
jgi:dihydroflavonol-4-reductase